MRTDPGPVRQAGYGINRVQNIGASPVLNKNPGPQGDIGKYNTVECDTNVGPGGDNKLNKDVSGELHNLSEDNDFRIKPASGLKTMCHFEESGYSSLKTPTQNVTNSNYAGWSPFPSSLTVAKASPTASQDKKLESQKHLQQCKARRLQRYGSPPPLTDFSSPITSSVKKEFKPPSRFAACFRSKSPKIKRKFYDEEIAMSDDTQDMPKLEPINDDGSLPMDMDEDSEPPILEKTIDLDTLSQGDVEGSGSDIKDSSSCHLEHGRDTNSVKNNTNETDAICMSIANVNRHSEMVEETAKKQKTSPSENMKESLNSQIKPTCQLMDSLSCVGSELNSVGDSEYTSESQCSIINLNSQSNSSQSVRRPRGRPPKKRKRPTQDEMDSENFTASRRRSLRLKRK